MTPRLRLPEGLRGWTIQGARVPACLLDPAPPAGQDGLATVDLTIRGVTIDAITPPGERLVHPDLPVWCDPGIVLPCFVDAHTHLDKGHIWPRAPNPDGTFGAALETVAADRQANWSPVDVRARMTFGLEAAYAHGTWAIRTHIDSTGPQTRISWPVFGELRDAWRDRIDLQASPLFGIDLALDDAHMRDVADMVGTFGTCLGAAATPGPALRPGLDRLFRLASERGYDLDFHTDETSDPTVNVLPAIAETALAFGFEGRILLGHCCTLSLIPPDEAKRTIDLVARAGLSIVSLPMCNLYLQDRGGFDRTPRWRGVTAIKELRAAGVPVMVASDNTRDPFYSYGDLDMLEVWREATRIAHLDHPFGHWADAVTAAPARALGLATDARLRAGAPADLVVLPARSLSELLARPAMARTVIRRGHPIEATPPSYARLDDLEGLTP